MREGQRHKAARPVCSTSINTSIRIPESTRPTDTEQSSDFQDTTIIVNKISVISKTTTVEHQLQIPFETLVSLQVVLDQSLRVYSYP